MRILVVSQSFYPDVFAINEIVKGLVERGHEITVLTGLPDYTTSEIPEAYRHGKNRTEDYCGAKVIRVPIIPRKHGVLFRCLNYLSFAVNASRKARFGKWESFDAIYVWEVSPVTMAIPAIVLKRRFKKPLFLYCLDIWPECIKAMGFQEKSLFYHIIHALSGWIYRNCDHIAVSSAPFFQYLEDVDRVSQKKMSYLPQFAPKDLLYEDLSKEVSDRTDFLYVGNVGKAQDMQCLVRAAAELSQRKDVRFHIVGGGSDLEETIAFAKKTGADRVMEFYGPKPFMETIAFYKKADACLITLDGSTRIGDTLPGKLQTYMAAGKPVIGALNGAGREVIEESGCGICAGASDERGFAECLLEFACHKEKYLECGEKGRSYFLSHFTEEQHFQRLEQQLESLISLQRCRKKAKRGDQSK